MPVIKSSKKALRQTKKRTILNKSKATFLKIELKKLKKEKDPKVLPKIYSLVDKMVKTHVIHKNKAGRIKSQVEKIVSQYSVQKNSSPKAAKKTSKKSL